MALTRSELSTVAARERLYIRTQSPGDGVTRYKFFRRERCKACLDVPGKDGLGNPCKICTGDGFMPQTNAYFGPGDGIFVAMGLREATVFLSGYIAAVRSRY